MFGPGEGEASSRSRTGCRVQQVFPSAAYAPRSNRPRQQQEQARPVQSRRAARARRAGLRAASARLGKHLRRSALALAARTLPREMRSARVSARYLVGSSNSSARPRASRSCRFTFNIGLPRSCSLQCAMLSRATSVIDFDTERSPERRSPPGWVVGSKGGAAPVGTKLIVNFGARRPGAGDAQGSARSAAT